MRALETVLVNLILHKSIERVPDALLFRVLHLHCGLNLEVLLFTFGLEELSFLDQSSDAFLPC